MNKLTKLTRELLLMSLDDSYKQISIIRDTIKVIEMEYVQDLRIDIYLLEQKIESISTILADNKF